VTQTRSVVVYAAGAVQGIVLVTAPAASTVFTGPDYHLTSAQYGAMFVPQVVTAVAASLLAGRLDGRFGTKAVYLTGLSCGLAAMALLVGSSFTGGSYAMLLAATAFLGAGFGLTVPALNSLTAAFHPRSPDSSVLVLNALLGLGTALAPVFVAVFVGLGFWWGLPILSGVLLAVLIAASLPLALDTRSAVRSGRLPRAFWLFAGFAVLYGACETVNGNWAQLDLTTSVGASATVAALALTSFWAMVTVGRVVFASLEHVIRPQWTFRLLPFALALVFVLVAGLRSPVLGVVAFGLAGLCCSALLPLTISLGQAAFPAVTAAVSGGVIAAYQVGYGISAFGIGPLHTAGVPLPAIYAGFAVVAVFMGALAFKIPTSTGQDSAVSRNPDRSSRGG
jgi:fucose permease